MNYEAELQGENRIAPDYRVDNGVITHTKTGKKVPNVSVTCLGLKRSTVNRLIRNKIATLSELLTQTKQQLQQVPQIGPIALDEIWDQVPCYLEAHQTDGYNEPTSVMFAELLYLAPDYTAADGWLYNKETGKAIRDVPIEFLNLSTRARNGLRRSGVKNISELIGLSTKELSSFKNVGIQTAGEIQKRLDQYLSCEQECSQMRTDASSEQVAVPFAAPIYPVLASEYIVVDGWICNKKTGKVIRDVPIECLDYSARARNGVRRNGVQNISGLIGLSIKTLSHFKNVGIYTANEIQEKLDQYLDREHECSQIFVNQVVASEDVLHAFCAHDYEEL